MLNLRPINQKFYLSGGWTDVPEDARWLALNNFRAVLDLQFTKTDYSEKSFYFVRDTLEEQNIKYFAVPMNDEYDDNLNNLFEVTYNTLADWEKQFTKPSDKILVKCGVGVSRSVAVLINYLCVRDRLTYNEAKEKVRAVDYYNYGGMPISIHPDLEYYLRNRYPDLSVFGEKE